MECSMRWIAIVQVCCQQFSFAALLVFGGVTGALAQQNSAAPEIAVEENSAAAGYADVTGQRNSLAPPFSDSCRHGHRRHTCQHCNAAVAGSWYWMREPGEERRRAIQIYNTLCVRCHGVNGRGAWDIPDVPNFTNARWQISRSDSDLVRLTLNGRGACMPAFKGTITLEEAWAVALYIRSLAQPAAERPRSSELDAEPFNNSEAERIAEPVEESSTAEEVPSTSSRRGDWPSSLKIQG